MDKIEKFREETHKLDMNKLEKQRLDQQKKTEDMIFKTIKIVAVIFIACFLLFGTLYKVNAGYRGILLTFGKPSNLVSGEGLHFKVPLIQKVIKMEVRTQKLEASADSASKDLQDVQTTIALNYHLIPGEVNKLYQEIGSSYQDRVISPSIQESVRAITAQFTAENLILERPKVREGIKEYITEKLSKYHIIVDDFNIINFQFSAKFDEAIEQKVTAEQLKLKADRDLERIKVEAEQTITAAKAEAESLRLQKQQISKDLIALRQIEAQLKAIEAWNGILPQVTGGAIPFIDISTLDSQQATSQG